MPSATQNIEQYYRHCPGEEQIRISDAVCHGRRRNSFPKCTGCPFNDDAKTGRPAPGGGSPGSASADADANRDRVSAVFGLHHVRGACPDPLDADLAWRVGLGTAQFLRSELRGYDRSQQGKATVLVGSDMRRGTPELREALIAGLRAGGSPVIDLGLIDTPQLWFAVNRLTCCGGVQVTAGRAPAETNGFKICGAKARPVTAETGLTKIARIVQNTVRHDTAQAPPLEHQDLTEPYREFVRRFVARPGAGITSDRPLRIVVDASNGMAGRWVPILFADFDWLDIVRLNFEHNGEFVHVPDPLVEANLVQTKDRVLRSKADLGVCFDGDADRLMVIDDQGRLVSPDHVMALIARHLLAANAGATVVHDLCCSRMVAEEVRKAGGLPRRERGTEPFLRRALESGKGIFGADRRGRYYFRDNGYCDSAMIALACLINLLTEAGRPLAELTAPLQRYANLGPRGFHHDHVEDLIRKLAARYGNARIDYLDGITVEYDDWWFNVSPAAGEPAVRLHLEARDQAMLERKLSEVAPLLGPPLTR